MSPEGTASNSRILNRSLEKCAGGDGESRGYSQKQSSLAGGRSSPNLPTGGKTAQNTVVGLENVQILLCGGLKKEILPGAQRHTQHGGVQNSLLPMKNQWSQSQHGGVQMRLLPMNHRKNRICCHSDGMW